jgi:5-methylcytosine-specific restriction endonuclease McrA
MTWSRTSRQSRGYGSSWTKLRAEILKRDDYLCQHCLPARVTSATEVHHVVEKARGGTDDPANLISTCSTCHREAHGVVIKHGFDRHGRSLDPASPWSAKR